MNYEKLGTFYLGKVHDLTAGRTSDELLFYDAKNLTAYAVCVGMTDSGTTGLYTFLLTSPYARSRWLGCRIG